jgi:hypothetical protein
MDNLKKFAPKPDDLDAQLDAPTSPTKGPFGGATWLNNPRYALVKPDHASELEQNAAVNEFGKKMPREQAELEAYGTYKQAQHKIAAAHHLAGMKAAHAAGDGEAARKHSLMYELHSKAIGHEPVGPAHPDVVAHLAENPKVYRFKPHHGDQLALSTSSGPASEPAPDLGKHEVGALNVVYAACQALLKAEGGVQAGAKLVTDKFHGQGKQLGASVQVTKGPPDPRAPGKPTHKGEMSPRAKGPKPCICSSYKFPHRHKSGKCGAGKL